MRFRLLLFFNSILLLNSISCEEEIKPRVLNRNDYEAFPSIEQQTIQEFSNDTSVDAAFEEVIDEIINSSRQGRNLDGLDDVYSDPTVKQALQSGDDTQARNLIRDKLCTLGLMECERSPVRYIHSKPPPQAFYNQRPGVRPPPPHPQSVGGYGPARPVPLPHSQQQQPPRKVGYAPPSNYNSFHGSKPLGPIHDKYSTDFYEVDAAPSAIKFGYTEKPTIVVNQGKREVPGVSQNHHVHHHYVHVDGNTPAVVDGTKTVLVNTPISEYSAVNSLSGSYQTSGFGASGSGSSGYNGNSNSGFNGNSNSGFSGSSSFNPSATDFEYKGVNSGLGLSQGIYGGSSSNVKPVFESNNQYASASNYNQQQQNFQSNTGPATFSEGSNGLYNVGSSYHASQPDFYKKELNLNGNRGNSLSGSNQYSQQNYLQQQQQQQFNKYSKNQYNQGEQSQGFESGRQDQNDCVCVPFDQCPAYDVVGRRDDLILPLDPRHLSTEIEADTDNSTVSRVTKDVSANNSTETHKISKRAADDVEKVQGEGRLFGFGGGAPVGGGGYYPQNGGHGGKKVLPTLGVSFGLPFPTHNYPISPYGNIPNPHFGAISPNGLNLGLLNVNPLFSLQVTKSEHGEKLVKPFVNLHVTPNEGIIGKIGGLFAAKKGALHHHYHNHLHRYPPPPPHIPFDHHHHHEPHFEGPFPPHFEGPVPPHFEGPVPPHFDRPNFPHHPPNHFNGPHPPPHFDGPIYSKPPPFYKDLGHHKGPIYEDIDINPGILGFRSNNVSFSDENDFPPNNQYSKNAYNYQSVYPQNENNLNAIKDDYRYARQYSNYNKNFANDNVVQSIPAQAPGASSGSDTVSFPSSRRRRDTDQIVPASIEKKENLESVDGEIKDSEGRALTAEKRQAFYQQPKQCGPRAVCCRKPNRPPQIQQQPNSNYNRCGVRNAQGINGRVKTPSYVDGNSEFGEYPWQAAILKKDPKESVYVCGGTLIDNQHIVTAAHCVKTYSGFDLRVRLGEWDVNHDVEFYPYVERDVISVHIHPEYYAGTLDNDLAILKLNQPVDFSGTPHISPACLPDKFTDFSGQRCWTTGWGKDNWEYGKYQNILKEVDVPVINQNVCQNQLRQTRLGFSYNLNPGFICAGGEEGKDACKGDGGGPLVCERNGIWQVAGIVSWGIGCGKANVPGVYVRVSHYLDWIAQITQRY